ncbi:MAG: c-type cytochrome [Acidimicrobiia bacterium]
MNLKRWAALLVALAGAAILLLLIAPVAAQDATTGQETYLATCAACHGADGTGVPGAFPPLVDNPKAQDPDYVAEVIQNGLSGPIDVNGEPYDAAMPAFGNLSDTDIADINAFLATNFQSDTPTTTTPPSAPAGPGNASVGEDLFLGANGFDGGGAACYACHTVGGRGGLGGQTMGPDLTGVVDRFGGEAGFMAAISPPAFPVMRELYRDKPFTEQEKADLAAFFISEADQEDKDSGDALLVIGLVGAGILFGGMVVLRPFAGAGYARRLRRNA